MEKATIYDYARMCRTNNCESCPFKLSGKGEDVGCADFIIANTNKSNEIILKWCEEHPIKTRQDKFLEVFPNAELDSSSIIEVCPLIIDKTVFCEGKYCLACRRSYWLAEAEKGGAE